MDTHLKTLKEKLDNHQAVIFDVREQTEWDEGHLKAATLVPLSKLGEDILPDVPVGSKEKDVYLYCRSGRRVYIAQPILEDMGFKSVIPLDEGFDDLCAVGFEEDF